MGRTIIKTAPPKPYDGINLLSILKGEQKQVARNLYLGYGSILNNSWKLVKANAGNPKMDGTEDMLFNILKDPSEKIISKLPINRYMKV